MYVFLFRSLIICVYFSDLCITPHWLSLSLPKVRNFFSTFKHPVRHEIVKSFTYSLVVCRHLLINYVPAVSEVVYRHLEVVVDTLKKAHIFALRTLKKGMV